jgi:hypothetical protein
MSKKLWVFTFVFSLGLAVFFSGQLSGQRPVAANSVSTRHPRIFLTPENLTAYRTKLGGPLREDFQEFVSYLDSVYDTAQSDSEYFFHIRNYAFLYAVGPINGIHYGRSRDSYGAKAVELLKQIVARGNPDTGDPGPRYALAAVGYDWCYPLLSPADRIALVNFLKTASKPEGPGGNRSAFHHVEIKWRTIYLLTGLAFANDGVDDGEAAARLGTYDEYITGDGGILPARNFIAGLDGGVSVGEAYAVNGTGGDGLVMAEMLFAEAWRTANGLTVEQAFASDNELRYFTQWIAYAVLPYVSGGNHILYAGHYMDRGSPAPGFGELSLAISAMRMYKDVDPKMASLAQFLIENWVGNVPNSGATTPKRKALLANFIFNPGGVVAKSPSELGLPLSKLFAGTGWLVMRSGWDNDGDTAVTFIASPFTRSPAYANSDQGSFTIDRNGPLAIHAGRGVHHAYSDMTRGYNTITFTDPNEPVGGWPEYWDMGGQRTAFNVPARLSQYVRGSQWDIGGIRASDLFNGAEAHDYDYVSADVTRAYEGPANNEQYNTSKVKLFTRQLVNFRRETRDGPDVVVVYDRTETVDTKFDKRWMFHPPGREDGAKAFEISGSASVAPGPTRNKSTAGKKTYDQPSLITITNTSGDSGGRLFWRPLLPANRVIVEVGGPDSAGKYSTSGSHEYEDAYGKQDIDSGNYGPELAQWVGQYSLELQPKNRALYDVFLNVFEATAPSQNTMSDTRLVNGTSTVGASIGTRMAVFNRTEGFVTSDTVMVPNGGTYKILLCDLQPGMNYDVNGTTVVAGSAGTAYLTVAIPAGGSLRIAATGKISELPPAAPTGLRITGK